MPKFVIERSVPGAGKLSSEELRDISAKSNKVLAGMAGVNWVTSYVTEDKIYCLYEAPDAAAVREHARLCAIPADAVNEVHAVIP